MCKILKVRYACKHLGRTLGTKSCEHAPLIRQWETQGIIPKTQYLYQHCQDACQREKDTNEVEYDYDERADVCPRCKRKESKDRAEAKAKKGRGKGKAEGSKSSKGKGKSKSKT